MATKANPYLAANLTDLREIEKTLSGRVTTVQTTLDEESVKLKDVRAAIKALEPLLPKEEAVTEGPKA